VAEAALFALTSVMGTAVALGWRWRWRHSLKERHAVVQVLLTTAFDDARHRGHAQVTLDHLLWVLFEAPEVVASCEARGWPILDLREALAARLGESGNERTAPEATAQLSEEVHTVVRLAHLSTRWRREPPGTASRMWIAALVRVSLRQREADLRLLERAACSVESFSLDRPAPRVEPEARLDDGAYRTPFVPPLAEVVFWNDDRTKMEAVVEILVIVFAMSRTRAVYLMCTTHYLGRATVRTCRRSEAESLADRAIAGAREKGMPLKVTVEEVS
jgi:ATP-dependent Clp protease adaptor protein ClpS